MKGVSSQTVCNGHVLAYVSAPFPTWLLNFEEFSLNTGTNISVYYPGGLSYDFTNCIGGESFELFSRFEDKQRDLAFDYETRTGTVPGVYVGMPPGGGILIKVSPQFIWAFADNFGEDDGQAGNWFGQILRRMNTIISFSVQE